MIGLVIRRLFLPAGGQWDANYPDCIDPDDAASVRIVNKP